MKLQEKLKEGGANGDIEKKNYIRSSINSPINSNNILDYEILPIKNKKEQTFQLRRESISNTNNGFNFMGKIFNYCKRIMKIGGKSSMIYIKFKTKLII
jgi:hypothetical protein